MRSLAQPKVLGRAAIAGLITTLACYPQLATWAARPGPLSILLVPLLWCSFILWAFVLAWHQLYTGRSPFAFSRQAKDWIGCTVYGIVSSALMYWLLDPQLRSLVPRDYPASWAAWLVRSLWNLGLNPLFLCFAPFAFFIRLARKESVAQVGTLVFGLFVFWLQVKSKTVLPVWWILAAMAAMGTAGTFMLLYFYRRGGVWMVWWLFLLAQLRHAVDLVHAR